MSTSTPPVSPRLIISPVLVPRPRSSVGYCSAMYIFGTAKLPSPNHAAASPPTTTMTMPTSCRRVSSTSPTDATSMYSAKTGLRPQLSAQRPWNHTPNADTNIITAV